nr:integrase arm-type DNA-binding domain-containing protein [uncultured Lichenicoccus sp.]
MLTDAKARNAKPADKRFKLFDAEGLYLAVEPNGSKLWRMKYRLAGHEKLLSFGPYPAVSLAAARQERDNARALLRTGADPAQAKIARRLVATSAEHRFEAIARVWHTQQSPTWGSRKHVADVLGSLEKWVFPKIGKLPISTITAPMLVPILRDVQQTAAETGHRIRQRLSMIFGYAIALGLIDADPAASIGKALRPVTKGKQPAIVKLPDLQTLLADVEATPAHALTKLAHRLLALTSVRSNEIRGAAWTEFHDLDGPAPEWRIPAKRMKMKREHVVPLSRQAVEIIETVRALTGRAPLLFPNTRAVTKPQSENAIGYLLNRAGYKNQHVPHGWRAAFSTLMNEAHPADRAVIDLMLAHENKNAVEAAYNRATHLERRRVLAQAWADMVLAGAMPAADLLHGPAR